MRVGNRRKWPWVLLFTTLLLVSVFYVGGGWYFANLLYADALEAVPYDPADLQEGSVLAIEPKGEDASITVLAQEAEREDTRFDDAVVGLTFGESLVVAGPGERGADGSLERRILDIQGAAPEPGDTYGLSRDVWLDPKQAGLPSRDVTISTLDGEEFPAWLIPGDNPRRWAILLHGRGAARSEMLRMARPIHRRGYNILIMTYRGDVGAPPYEDGTSQYGRVEWEEAEAAVRYVGDRGATRIVLGGASHGGAVALGFLARSPLATRVDGVILDSPASSFQDVIDEAADFRTLPVGDLPIPESLEDAAMLLASTRFNIDYSAVDYITKEDLIRQPLLTIQGAADTTVPQPVSDRFMLEGSGQDGTYVVVEDAEHVLSWNVDRDTYEDAIRDFLRSL